MNLVRKVKYPVARTRFCLSCDINLFMKDLSGRNVTEYLPRRASRQVAILDVRLTARRAFKPANLRETLIPAKLAVGRSGQMLTMDLRSLSLK